MMKYDWKCQVCGISNDKAVDVCTTCHSPSRMSSDDLLTHRNNWEAQQKSQQSKFACMKCGSGEYTHGQLRASAGRWSAMFELSNARFTHITCASCGFTEFYKNDVGTAENIIDILIN